MTTLTSTFLFKGIKIAMKVKERVCRYIEVQICVHIPTSTMHFKILNMELSSIVFTMVRSPYIKGSHLFTGRNINFKKNACDKCFNKVCSVFYYNVEKVQISFGGQLGNFHHGRDKWFDHFACFDLFACFQSVCSSGFCKFRSHVIVYSVHRTTCQIAIKSVFIV